MISYIASFFNKKNIENKSNDDNCICVKQIPIELSEKIDSETCYYYKCKNCGKTIHNFNPNFLNN